MPIYEYQCTECGELHEALQKLSDAPLVDCPACGKAALRKKVTAAAFRLKGSGWYETDFKSGDKKNLAGDAAKDSASKADGGKAPAGADKGGDGSPKTKDSKASQGKQSSDAAKSAGGA